MIMMPSLRSVSLKSLPDWTRRLSELDPIFFEASATKTFPDAASRSAFRERWLGRYLARWPDLAYLALAGDETIGGYIVGAHADPAVDPVFADIGYWPEIAHLTRLFPAHLHINLAPSFRGGGAGSALIEAFCRDARQAGAAGVHVVTGRRSRNRSFYARNAFDEVAAFDWGGTPIVMLARSLDRKL